jgi:hypothetical protein
MELPVDGIYRHFKATYPPLRGVAQVLYGCCTSTGNNGELITGNRYLPKRVRICALENIVLTVNKKSYQDQYECNQIIGTSQMLKPWEEINVGSKPS